MAFWLGGINNGYWLYTDDQKIALPLDTGRSVAARTAFSLAARTQIGQIQSADPTANYQYDAFVAAQDRTLTELKTLALAVRSRVAEVDLPSGDLIGLMKVAQPSNRSFWTGEAENRGTRDKYLVRVPNLSHSQINKSVYLNKTGTSDLESAYYIVSLTVDDGDPIELHIVVDYYATFPDDNQAILQRLAQAIEMADQNLVAYIEEGTRVDDNGLSVPTVSLTVATRQAGEAKSFVLADVQGDMIETLNLNSAIRSGQDLQYLRGTARSTPYGDIESDYWRAQPGQTLTSASPWFTGKDGRQINQTPTLDPTGKSDLPAGRYRFKVTSGETSEEVYFDIDYRGYAPDDNLAILNRLAYAIKSATGDLEASVVEDEAADDDDQIASGVRLFVASRNTGQSFTLADLDGDLIERLGLNRPAYPAQPASEAEAGLGGTRPTDRFGLDETRLNTQARQLFFNPESLLVTPAEDPVVDQVKNVASANNSFLTALTTAQEYFEMTVARKLAEELFANAVDYSQIGITVSSLGRVEVTSDFKSRLEEDLALVRERLSGSSGLLTIIDRNMKDAVEGGLEESRIRRPDRVYNSAATVGAGYDPFYRVNSPQTEARILAAGILGRRMVTSII